MNGGDSSTDTCNVVPIPKLPAIGISALLIDIIANNMGVKLICAGDCIVGMTWAIPVSVAIVDILINLLMLYLLFVIIHEIVKTAIDAIRKSKKDVWALLRHYTKIESIESILTPRATGIDGLPIYVMIGGSGGECPVEKGGPYLTNDVLYSTNDLESRKLISSILGIKHPPPNNNPEEVTGYIDLTINTTDYPNYLSEFKRCVIRNGTQLHHDGPLVFGPPTTKLPFKLIP